MSVVEVPDGVGRDLIELLFDDGTPSSLDSLLLVNPTPTVATVLEEYYDAEITASAPTTTVVHQPEDPSSEFDWGSFSDSMFRTDFLNPNKEFGTEFDYILCLPSEISANDLSHEDGKDLATNFASHSIDAETINASALHFEQTLKHLSPSGRGTLLAGPEFQSDDVETFRDQFYYSIDHIDAYDPAETRGISEPRAATLVTHTDHEAGHSGFTYNPEQFESLLGRHVDTDRPFEVAAIMTADPVGYGINESASETYFDLHYRDFDAALVFDDPDQRTGVRGYVSRQRLRSGDGDALREQQQELTEEILLAPEAGIQALIESLSTSRFQFVGSPDEVQGIVTRFDLNRLPVFLHLFDRFSELEIGLRNLIRTELPNWEDETSVYVHSQSNDDLYTDKLASASLSNLVEIVDEAGLDTEIRRDIRGYDVTLDDLVTLRNMVAHYNPIVHTMGGSSEHSDERDASQLWAEYKLLIDAIDGLDPH